MIYDLNNDFEKEKFKTKVNAYYENGKKVELKLVRHKRSINQNSYVHVLFDLFAIEYGLTASESKQLVKENCPLLKYEKEGHIFIKGTSDLSIEEMGQFIEWFRDWAAKEGCYLPDAKQYEHNYNNFDNEINKNKQYL